MRRLGGNLPQEQPNQNGDLDRISDEYRLIVYQIWYNRGRPSAERLLTMVEADPLSGIMPSVPTLSRWIRDYFVPSALELDQQVTDQVETKLVEQKLEMLDRHAEIGRSLQKMGLEFLDESGIGNARNALMAVLKGVEMEHNARILPTDIVRKLDAMTDEQILKEFTDMLKDGQLLDIGPLESDDDFSSQDFVS